ncbi:hypothetical protein CC2G_001166 [Coprinopsis cinerea AmutBmut pab1-1]|nr:hypothetical protein CC2G_001166 [Coprinopsis cinerea AmutBmut pab1-1]
MVRHRFFPAQPVTLILTLISILILAILLALFLIYTLNPDKEPLPWRAYCSIPSLATPRDHPYPLRIYPEIEPGELIPPFPPANLENLPPAGILIGVFSVDSAFERRMLIRTTWAAHARSRNGAVGGDGGRGTSRTVVRFILGQPRQSWERRIKLEMDTYNDVVILPIPENMNNGKTHTFFSWASLNAWVPPVYNVSEPPLPRFSYSNYTASPPPLAPHDPISAWHNIRSHRPKPWIRPDYVVKADDDAFIMLAELEARLRVELHNKPKFSNSTNRIPRRIPTATSLTEASPIDVSPDRVPHISAPFPETMTDNDPLIYWGYLVTNRLHQFMAGELYALSWSLVDWVAKDAAVKGMTKGAEDKQTAKWMRLHPRADRVRWTSERCWIYDHPRSGTVYGHGFLFPSEVTRIKKEITSYVKDLMRDRGHREFAANGARFGTGNEHRYYRPRGSWRSTTAPESLTRSTVSTFGVRYTPPLRELSERESIEALVEGSEMSLLERGGPITPEQAWLHREGRRTQYENQRVGGTVAVHFIKKNAWYLEAAIALLEGEEESEAEQYNLPTFDGFHLSRSNINRWAPWTQDSAFRRT